MNKSANSKDINVYKRTIHYLTKAQIDHLSEARTGASYKILTKGWSFRHALRSWASRLNAMPDMICGLLQ